MISFDDAESKDLFGHFPSGLLERFKEFHANNSHVYDAFVDNARKMKKTGRKRYSANAIVQRIRWEMDIQTNGDPFKIDDSFTPIYGRLAEYNNDELKGFFEFRS